MKEQKEIELLLGKGFEFHTSFFGFRKAWRTKKMTLGRLIALSELFLKMKIDTEIIKNGDLHELLAEQYRSVKENGKNAAKVISICVSDSKILRPFLTRHFLNNINAEELSQFAENMLKQADYQNFITSIVLMNGNRITKPQTIEKEETA